MAKVDRNSPSPFEDGSRSAGEAQGAGSGMDWLDDPFDESKGASEADELRRGSRTGCLLVAVIAIVLIALSVLSIGFLEAIEGL